MVFVLLIIVLLAAPASAQNPSAAPQPASAHGLVLTLSQDESPDHMPDPPDVESFKDCMAEHPKIGCIPLTITIKNEGHETILTTFGSCSGMGLGIDVKGSTGAWLPFLTDGAMACASNISVVQIFSPGKSYAIRRRLVDPLFYLVPKSQLPNAMIPDPAMRDPKSSGSRGSSDPSQRDAVLRQPGPHIIRAHRYLDGCIISNKVNPEKVTWVDAASLCIGDPASMKPIILQSNELQLTASPDHH